ncbi:DnaJ domain-containing protein [Ruegeria sp.]|uniref:DnaJ domain-containing protein n=1 Tax=Ruegeria sp. TaxID=1879320 RepID=UPI00230E8FF9|nr:DnaJ domain-containing protein [Ruegeria sp.]MDA7964754.1 DnaJ domain-containing protein [Ruegeria sp.]
MSKIKARAEALEALGLSQGASADEIREAWRTVAFHAHPDHTGGDYSGFAQAKSAYDFLRKEGLTAQNRSGPAVPRRPQLRKRVVELTRADLDACRDLLSPDPALPDMSDRGETDQAGKRDDTPADHIPDAIGCFGRDLTYFVKTPVSEGSNRVALPTSVLAGSRKAEAEVLTFQSKNSGQGEVVIPDALRERKFPGARSVRIRFDSDQQMQDDYWLAS